LAEAAIEVRALRVIRGGKPVLPKTMLEVARDSVTRLMGSALAASGGRDLAITVGATLLCWALGALTLRRRTA
jgi:hypothetical protein